MEFGNPDAARDPVALRWFTRSQRFFMRPREASIFLHREQSVDVRDALASVRVPTLVIHRDKFVIPAEQGRYVAEHIDGARFLLVEGSDGVLFTEPSANEIISNIEEFLGGLRAVPESDRALAAILYTDIVESTQRVAALGDREWRTLLDTHDAVARTMVSQYRGRVVKMTGDGMLAIFDGPGRAIRCATALGDALRPLGLEIRAGLHTGEVEMRETDIAGIAAHIAARVLQAAGPGDLMVSAAVPMLVAGSGFDFEDRGEHELKGVPGAWRLFAVVAS
jgi:class 3 adenylate cyclase